MGQRTDRRQDSHGPWTRKRTPLGRGVEEHPKANDNERDRFFGQQYRNRVATQRKRAKTNIYAAETNRSDQAVRESKRKKTHAVSRMTGGPTSTSGGETKGIVEQALASRQGNLHPSGAGYPHPCISARRHHVCRTARSHRPQRSVATGLEELLVGSWAHPGLGEAPGVAGLRVRGLKG